jgi:hypothetical protein
VYRSLFKEKWEISGRRFTVDLHFYEILCYREFYSDYESPFTEVVFNWKKSPYSTRRSRTAAPWKMDDWFNYISSSFLLVHILRIDLLVLRHVNFKNTCIRYQSSNVLWNPPKENYNFINTWIYQLANASLTETIFKLKPLQICGTQLFTGCDTRKLYIYYAITQK